MAGHTGRNYDTNNRMDLGTKFTIEADDEYCNMTRFVNSSEWKEKSNDEPTFYKT